MQSSGEKIKSSDKRMKSSGKRLSNLGKRLGLPLLPSLPYIPKYHQGKNKKDELSCL
jgi:hypothetical protein